MQKNFTKNKFIKNVKLFMSLTFLSLLLSGLASAQTYINGNLGTGTTASTGATAPAGTQWHELQTNVGAAPVVANASLAFAYTGNFTVADNFTVPAGETWNISGMTFYAIQPAAAPITALYVRIHNASPLAGATTIVYGDLTTNRLGAVAPANIYGIFNATPATTYPIQSMAANVTTSLTAGTYWVEWKVVSGAATFAPTSAVVGSRSQPSYNAIQSNLGVWTALVDAGTPASAPSVPQDLPFRIAYSATGSTACTGTPAPGNTVASATAVCPGVTFNLSLQTATTGAGVTYQWQRATAATGPWTNIIGATLPTLTYSLSATTFYRAVVTCGANSGNSNPVQVAASTGCYCTPGAVNCTLDDAITNVTLGTLNNTSACSAGGYANYTTNTTITVPNIIQGGANPMRVTVGPGGTEFVGVWVDYNSNGTFETTEFQLLGSGNGSTIVGTLNVPATAPLGTTRMRVRVQYNTAVLATQACTATSGFGEVEDYNVTIVPCVPTTITTQPVAASIACGGNTTFSVALAGSLPVAYWEYRPNATAVWQNVPATAPFSTQNTTTLTLTNVPASFNGYQFRAVFSGACTGVDFSNAVTLTVTPYLAPISPVPAVKCTNSNLQIFASPPPSVTSVCSPTLNLHILDGNITGVNNSLNVSGIPAGATISNINVKLNVNHAYVADLMVVLKAPNGKIINLSNLIGGANDPGVNFTNTVFSSAAGLPALNTGTSPGYTGTFRPDAALTGAFGIPTGPTGFTANTAVFSDLGVGNVNGAWTIAMYDAGAPDEGDLINWCLNITWGVAPATAVFTPTTNLFLDAAATVPYTGTAVNSVYTNTPTNITYTATVSNGTCTSAPTAIPVTVTAPLSTVTVPATAAACQNGSTTITAAAATGTPSVIAWQWQVSTDGGTVYNTIVNNATYSGATTSTLTINNAALSMTGNRYRAIATITACSATSVTSAPSVLTVNALPVLNLTANPYTAIYPGQTTTLAVASTTTVPANGYTWTRNGVVVAGATGNTLVVDVDGLGEYSVSVNDANGCGAAAPATISIADASSDIMFIYPNPNSGQFQIRYHSAAGNSALPRIVNIYDGKGARVYSRTYSIAVPYSRLDVDMSAFQKGIYQVELADKNGNRLKTGRVVIR